jgi:multiple sugar transport system ATP-binding protein
MGTLTLQGITKSYGTLEVLHGISLDVADGEFVALVGPSGCGKSTLLRMIAGLDSVTGGQVLLNGICVNETAPKDRDVAMVFQSYALYPHMTVRENMGFALRMAGVPRPAARAQIAKVADILGLAALLDRKPKELSGGQMQRVAMGRAIVRNPAIFLFDEPLSNLDAKLRGKVRAEIQALHARLGTTTVYVTHDQVEAMTLADRLVVMRDGHVEQIGTPLQLYDRPETPFVAGFIGSPAMNLFTGQAAEGGLHLASGTVLPLPQPVSGEVTLGIRPEHLIRTDTGWPMTVGIVETMGNETHISGRIGGSDATLTIRTRDFPEPGSVIHVTPDPAMIHLFRNNQRLNRTA